MGIRYNKHTAVGAGIKGKYLKRTNNSSFTLKPLTLKNKRFLQLLGLELIKKKKK